MNQSRLQSWEALKSQELFVATPWIKLSVQQIRLSDSRVIDEYYQIELPEFAVIFAHTSDGKVIMER